MIPLMMGVAIDLDHIRVRVPSSFMNRKIALDVL